MGDFGQSRKSADTTQNISTTNEQIGVSDSGIANIVKGPVKEFNFTSQNVDKEVVNAALDTGKTLFANVTDLVRYTQATQSQSLALTANALNDSAKRESDIEATRINPENASQRNILIAVGIGGAVLVFFGLKK